MQEEFMYMERVPKERIAVLIGKEGKVKKEIEQATKSKLDIDSKEGIVRILGKESLGLFTAREIIKAIGRGFNPDTAIQLLKTDYSFELINLSDYAKSKNAMERLKGRVIGKEGKSRKFIENTTDTAISVYGKTIGIIGKLENVAIARRGVENLLEGSTHASVFNMLEKKMAELHKAI